MSSIQTDVLVGVHQPDDIGNDKGMTARSPDDKSLFHMFSIYVAGTLTGYRQTQPIPRRLAILFIAV
jgi:hypothetical protein